MHPKFFPAAVLLLPIVTLAQESAPGPPPPAAGPPEMRAARARGELRIDGRLAEADWGLAPPAGAFIQRDPEEGKPASEPTEVRILYDDAAIYVGARLHDREPGKIRARLARRDDETESDLFQVAFDSFHDRLTAWLFQVNPAGAVRDAAIYSDGNEDDSWDGVWEAAASVDSAGWTVELRIPLSQLHYRQGGDSDWGVQLYRLIHRKQESDYFAFTPKSEQGGVNRFGRLSGLEGLPAKRHLELLPYAVGQGEFGPSTPGDPFQDGSDYSGSVGLDLKYSMGPDLTLSAAANPDFGQAEVDPAIVNLSAFETFYPEKRPFFVSDAGNFDFGSIRTMNNFGFGETFYTRRIGRAPHRRLSGDYSFLDEPDEGTIAAAAKLTGRTGSGLAVGLLEAVTTREKARFVDSGGIRGSAEVEPLTNFMVARLSRDFRGGDSQAGVLVSGVQRDLSDSTLDATLHSSAYTAGFDWKHAWSKRAWSLDGFLLGSLVRGSPEAVSLTQRASAHYYQRPDAGHLEHDPTRTSLSGYHGEVALARNSGKHWLGSVMMQAMSPGYEDNDLGFMNRADRHTFTSIVLYQENQPGPILRLYHVYPFNYQAWNYDGDLITSGYAVGTYAQLANYWETESQFRFTPSTLDDRLTRGGPLARTPGGRQLTLSLGSDPRRPWTLEASGDWYDDDHGGRSDTYSLEMAFHPSPGLRLEVGPTWQRSTDPAQYVLTRTDLTATATGGARYVFARLKQESVSLETRLNWVFTPKISLQLYLQPLIASGLYRDYGELHAPETFDFDRYGRDEGTITRGDDGFYTVDPDAAGPAESFQFGDPNFNFRSLRGNAVLRWEYRPGSTIFLIWQQDRSGTGPEGDFDLNRDLKALGDARAENIVMLKIATWLPL